EIQPLAGIRRPSAGQANDVQVLVQVQLAVAQLQPGQGEVLRALGVPLRELIGLADVHQLDALRDVSCTHGFKVTQARHATSRIPAASRRRAARVRKWAWSSTHMQKRPPRSRGAGAESQEA